MKWSDDLTFQERVLLPLLMSLFAGLSTCLGATVVFCARTSNDNNKQQSPALSHNHMAFALSLAGSVMCTVSVASILPESFQDRTPGLGNDDSYHVLPFGSKEFGQRCLSFIVGCLLYLLLSKCAFPEPDDILGFEQQTESDEVVGLVVHSEIPLSSSTHSQRKEKSSTFVQRKKTNTTVYQIRREDSVNDSEQQETSAPPDELSSTSSHLATASGGGESSFAKNQKDSRKSKRLPLLSWSGSDLSTPEARRAWRVAMLLFVSLAVHNFPEGLAVVASALHSQSLGMTTTVAIALHNIPEGIAIAVPCLAARPDSPFLAFALASFSGLAEPMGAAVALLILPPPSDTAPVSPFWDMDNILAFVAGIMIMVAVLELFPEARRHAKDRYGAFAAGTISGAIVMLASDAVLQH